jgi:hypothetical protein
LGFDDGLQEGKQAVMVAVDNLSSRGEVPDEDLDRLTGPVPTDMERK